MQLRRKQRGVTLVETMLTMVVALGLLYMLGKMQEQATADTRAKNTAEVMQSWQNLALMYLIGNRGGIEAAVKDGTTPELYCVINANPTTGAGGATSFSTTNRTCAVDVAWLKYKKIAPADLSETNPYHQKLYAIYRLVDTTSGDFEMLLVGGENSGNEIEGPAKELGLAAEIMGGNGGIIPPTDYGSCQYNGTTKNACGTGGGWKLDLSKYTTS